MTSNLLDQKTINLNAEVIISKESDLRALTNDLRQQHDVIKMKQVSGCYYAMLTWWRLL